VRFEDFEALIAAGVLEDLWEPVVFCVEERSNHFMDKKRAQLVTAQTLFNPNPKLTGREVRAPRELLFD